MAPCCRISLLQSLPLSAPLRLIAEPDDFFALRCDDTHHVVPSGALHGPETVLGGFVFRDGQYVDELRQKKARPALSHDRLGVVGLQRRKSQIPRVPASRNLVARETFAQQFRTVSVAINGTLRSDELVLQLEEVSST